MYLAHLLTHIDIKTPPTIHHHHQHLLLLLLLVVMVFFTCLRFKRARRSSKGVEDAEAPYWISDLIRTSLKEDQPPGRRNQQQQPMIRRFSSWEEMVGLSRNFSTVIGQGGYTTVYLAYFSDSYRGALKIYPASERLNQIYKQELDILLNLRHQNIVQLLGYCDEQGDIGGSALVFEYLPNGSLQDKLHGNGIINKPAAGLPWKNRMWIAYQLATAIRYLHDECSFPIVHGDIKASNILLDNQLNVKLCDFGSAKMASSTLSSPHRSLMGSPGYTDPHYLRTGMASIKNDVYSFGVIILELITGMEAFCSHKGQLLTTIAGPLVRDMVDPRALMAWTDQNLIYNTSVSEQELMAMASISALCLKQQLNLRPSMADILTTMRSTIPSISSFLANKQ